ncbi:hypothetical protein [Halochromatium roseum]|uniref:hypothetical protein n=1 Tax=Halochromatium roseum TaxID=391920 RepID=UPI00191162AD|nr:hypothetical protein [Halochromatium roseum]MBK5938413.1 hypothetical protein [Halochromatium roseum]
MSTKLLLHTEQTLDNAARAALNHQLQAELGGETHLEPSSKPHLLFASHDPARATSQQLLAVLQKQGLSARFVDL